MLHSRINAEETNYRVGINEGWSGPENFMEELMLKLGFWNGKRK